MEKTDEEHNDASTATHTYDKFKKELPYTHKRATKCNVQCLRNSLQAVKFKILPSSLCFEDTLEPIVDPALALNEAKNSYKIKLERTRACYKTPYSSRHHLRRWEKVQQVIPLDPDQFLNTRYNWYYTGGTLNTQKHHQGLLLYYAVNNKHIHYLNLAQNDENWIIKHKARLTNIDEDCTPYQILTRRCFNDVFMYVRRRSRYEIYKHKFDEFGNSSSFTIQDSVNHDVPYVSMCVNDHTIYDYALIDANHVVTVLDHECVFPTINKKIDFENPVGHDSFAQLDFLDANTLGIASRFNIYLLDNRESSRSVPSKLNHKFLSGSEITNMHLPRVGQNYAYITTTKDILKVDIRKMSVINTWPHLLEEPPLFSSFISEENKNYLTISSLNPTQKLMLTENEPVHYLPVTFPSLLESYESGLLKLPKMNKIRIRKKLKLTTTGMHMNNLNNTFSVFTNNSLGDVFCFNISPDQNNVWCKNNNIDIFHDFSSEPEKEFDKELKFVDKVILQDIRLHTNSTPTSQHNEELSAFSGDILNTIEKSNKLADAWYDGVDRVNLDDIEELPSVANVQNWLSNYSNSVPDDLDV